MKCTSIYKRQTRPMMYKEKWICLHCLPTQAKLDLYPTLHK